uniref:Uncharacterized protein n=1 Tax=Arundo donax TaxID=35708 RepID=A0A0A9DX68_ARUDO
MPGEYCSLLKVLFMYCFVSVVAEVPFLYCNRPLSKTVRFNVLKVIPAGTTGGSGVKKAFTAD